MDRPIIEAMIASLPVSEMGRIAEDHEIWEEIDGGAFLTVTRHILTSTESGIEHEVVALQISGPLDERFRVISEFVDVLGSQAQIDMGREGTGEPDTVMWVIS